MALVRLLTITVLFLSALRPALADEKPDLPAASSLVRFLLLDELSWKIYQKTFRDKLDAGEFGEKAWRCFDSARLEDFNRTLANPVAAAFTSDELEAASTFFRMPTGAKLLNMIYKKQWDTDPENFPLPYDRPKLGLTFSELQELQRYAETPAGQKLANPLNILALESVKEELRKFTLSKYMACGDLK